MMSFPTFDLREVGLIFNFNKKIKKVKGYCSTFSFSIFSATALSVMSSQVMATTKSVLFDHNKSYIQDYLQSKGKVVELSDSRVIDSLASDCSFEISAKAFRYSESKTETFNCHTCFTRTHFASFRPVNLRCSSSDRSISQLNP